MKDFTILLLPTACVDNFSVYWVVIITLSVGKHNLQHAELTFCYDLIFTILQLNIVSKYTTLYDDRTCIEKM